MANQTGEKVILTDVPFEKLVFYKDWATSLGGKFTSVQQEPDGEFTIVILLPGADPAGG